MRRRSFLSALLALPSCGSDDGVAPRDAGGRDGAGDAGGTGGSPNADGGDGAASGWRTDSPLPNPLQEMTAVAYGGRILVAGGFQGATIVDRVLLYDPVGDAWSDGPPMPARRHHLSLAALNGSVYALGGLEEITFSPKASCFRLDAGASAWTPIAPLPNARGAAAAGAVDGRIVLAGGFGTGALLPLSLLYDPKADQWELGAPLPSPREHLAGFVHDDQFWTVGGREFSLSTNTNKVEVYDPKSDTWRGAPDLPTPRGGLGASVLDGKAYVIGGETPSAALDVVEVLDLASETWTPGPPVPTRRHGHAQAAVGGRIYVIGGGDEPNFAAVSIVESFAP